VLQFADGLFPAGAYAHSFGLEAYVVHGLVFDADSVEQLLRAHLAGSAAPADAVAVVNALKASAAKDSERCIEIDARVDAMKPVAELRDASRQMGRQTARASDTLIEHPVVQEFARLAAADLTPCHHSVMFGIAGGAQQWSLYEAAAAYLYSSTAAIVGAALRLIPLGQLKGQRVIRNLMPLISALANDATAKGLEEMAGFAPGLEIASMKHAMMDARLFRS
jgi:urease accessory protein